MKTIELATYAADSIAEHEYREGKAYAADARDEHNHRAAKLAASAAVEGLKSLSPVAQEEVRRAVYQAVLGTLDA